MTGKYWGVEKQNDERSERLNIQKSLFWRHKIQQAGQLYWIIVLQNKKSLSYPSYKAVSWHIPDYAR